MRLLMLLLVFFVSCISAEMGKEELWIYLLTLANDCTKANKDIVTCRTEAMKNKPELHKHREFMGEEFKTYFELTSRIVSDADGEAIAQYYENMGHHL